MDLEGLDRTSTESWLQSVCFSSINHVTFYVIF